MCLSYEAKKLRKPKNFVEAYKSLRRSWTVQYNKKTKQPRVACWRSELSQQIWDHGVPVYAKAPGETKFSGSCDGRYSNGIHAFKQLPYVGTYHGRGRPMRKIIKVLLFGVTHSDSRCYRADCAIAVEALDSDGVRIPW